ncbi:LamG domain-containing protein [bacterium]|nr:LamG domain-containing protein [Candidatus Elulimicrobium humile]
MPNVFKFSSTSNEKSLRKGNFSIGVGDVSKGPSPQTGFYNGITPPEGGWTIYHRRGDGNNFGIYTASTLNLVSLTNGLDGKTFTQVWQCLNHFAGTSSKVIVNRDFSPIVTDGLVWIVDASNTLSYPATGSTWYDISGNSKNGALQNSPLFSTESGGGIVFDGINDVVNFGTGNTFFPLSQFTIDIWFKSGGTVSVTGTAPGLFGFTYGLRAILYSTYLYFQSIGSPQAGNVTTLTTTGNIAFLSGSWFNVVMYHSGTSAGIYVNGVLNVTTNSGWNGTSDWPTNIWNLGRDNNNSFQFFKGEIPICRMYNRVLTAQEVSQNYYQGPIVTTGLIMALDAGNLVSYSGSGTTWNDLSGSGNNVTLYNTPTYNNGFLIGDGTSAYARTTNTLNLTNLSSITIIVVFKVPSTSSGGILYEHTNNWNNTGNYSGVSYGGFGIAVNSNGSTTTANMNHHQLRGNSDYSGANVVSPDNTKFQHYTTIHNFSAGSGSETLVYINGSLVNSSLTYSTNNTSTFADDYLYLWSRGGNTSFSNATLGFVFVYNRALSPSEILQNYGATKWRFGL